MEAPAPALADGQVLVRLVYLSLDPTNRVWMNEADSYLPALKLGDVMRGGGHLTPRMMRCASGWARNVFSYFRSGTLSASSVSSASAAA